MLITLATILVSCLPIQSLTEPVPRGEEAAAAAPLDGLWPTENLIRLVLLRITDDVSGKFELDEDQQQRYQSAEVDRWLNFARENRSAIQPVVNEFIELRMGLEPPDKERVQDWAERATPLFERFREKITEATDEFQEVLNPLQLAKFQADLAQFGVGMQFAEKKLEQWRSGEFKPDEFWEPTQRHRRRQRDERRRREAEAAEGGVAGPASPQQADQIARQVGEWERYVQDFIRLHKLDGGQRDTARSMLTELKQRALDHRDGNKARIARLEARIASHTGTEEDLAQIEAELVTVYGPVDDLFAELTARLDGILTTEQKARPATEPDDEG